MKKPLKEFHPQDCDNCARMLEAINDAERKAWDALSRYKFMMFGYWAAIWVHLNRASGARRRNPFVRVVSFAREQLKGMET